MEPGFSSAPLLTTSSLPPGLQPSITRISQPPVGPPGSTPAHLQPTLYAVARVGPLTLRPCRVRQPGCLSADEQIKQTWCIQTTEERQKRED